MTCILHYTIHTFPNYFSLIEVLYYIMLVYYIIYTILLTHRNN